MSKVYVPIDGTIKTMTDRAIKFEFEMYGEKIEKWIPKSVCEDPFTLTIGEDVTVGIAEWFCEKEDIHT